MTVIYVALILLWLTVIGLAAVVVALARQIGVLHERVAPVGALMIAGGPAVGSAAPEVLAHRLDGSPITLGGALSKGKAQLLLFISAQCPVCKRLIPLAKSVARSERLDVVFIGDAEAGEQRQLIADQGLQGFTFVNGPEVGLAYQVEKLPYAVLLDPTGKIAAKGLVNSREHLESLVTAAATGYESIQAYVRERAERAEAESA